MFGMNKDKEIKKVTKKPAEEVTKEVKKEVKKQNSTEEFIELAKDLKEIVVDQNQRLSEVESLVNRIAQRMGL